MIGCNPLYADELGLIVKAMLKKNQLIKFFMNIC